MSLYVCACGYQTMRKDAYDMHLNRKFPCKEDDSVVSEIVEKEEKAMELIGKCQCSKCLRVFCRPCYKNEHEKTCNGLLPLQCECCHVIFNTANEKYKHYLTSECGLSKLVPFTVTVTTEVNDDKPKEAQRDFYKPDLSSVITYFRKEQNLIFLKKAYDDGLLHEAVMSILYFKGPEKNRNILGIDRCGAWLHILRVFDNGVGTRKSIKWQEGLLQTLMNVRYIVNYPEIRFALDTSKNEIVPHPNTMTPREIRKLRQRHKELILNKGDYNFSEAVDLTLDYEIAEVQPSTSQSTTSPDSPPPTPETSTASSSNSQAASDSESSTDTSNTETIPTRRGVKGGRRPPSKAIRQHIHDSQDGLCNRCGTKLLLGWHADHIVPLFQNGTNEISNLQGLCPPCHVLKSACELSGTPLPECIKKEDPMQVILNEVRELRQELGRVALPLTP